MLVEKLILDQIEVKPDTGHIFVQYKNCIIREIDILDEDGKKTGTQEEIVSFEYHRQTLEKNADLTGQPEEVVAIATALWGL